MKRSHEEICGMVDLAERQVTERVQKKDNNKFLKSCIRPAHFGYNERTDVFKDINGTADPEGKRRNPVQGSVHDHGRRQVTAFAQKKGLSSLNRMEILRKNRTTCIIAIVFRTSRYWFLMLGKSSKKQQTFHLC